MGASIFNTLKYNDGEFLKPKPDGSDQGLNKNDILTIALWCFNILGLFMCVFCLFLYVNIIPIVHE